MTTLDTPNPERDPEFEAWVASLPAKSWAKYDLSACRLGWDASRASLPQQPVEVTEEIAAHLSWLHTYVRAMDETNWRDMRLHIASQVTRLEAALRRPSGDGIQPADNAFAEYEGVTAKELAETVARYGKALTAIRDYNGAFPASTIQGIARTALIVPQEAVK